MELLLEGVQPTQSKLPAWSYKCGWYAVAGRNPREVAKALNLTGSATESPWVEKSWTQGVRSDALFITPQVGGWLWVVGPELLEHPFDELDLSQRLHTTVQFFASHRGADAYRWDIAKDGQMIRSWETADGEVRRDLGRMTEAESEWEAGLVDMDEERFLSIAASLGQDHRSVEAHTLEGVMGLGYNPELGPDRNR